MTGSSTEAVASARAFAIEVARLLHDRHCEDVLLLDVQGLSQVCNFVLIGSGTSDRQMKAVADELRDLGDERGHPCFRASADTDATWIVVDFVDLVTHMFEPSLRAYYDLEGLWSDARHVRWERDGDDDDSRA
jgi:ribosome-associated protein